MTGGVDPAVVYVRPADGRRQAIFELFASRSRGGCGGKDSGSVQWQAAVTGHFVTLDHATTGMGSPRSSGMHAVVLAPALSLYAFLFSLFSSQFVSLKPPPKTPGFRTSRPGAGGACAFRRRRRRAGKLAEFLLLKRRAQVSLEAGGRSLGMCSPLLA